MSPGPHSLAPVAPPYRIALSNRIPDEVSLVAREARVAHLDLVNIDFAVLLAQFFVCLLHRVKRRHSITQILRGKRSALDIERLLCELR